MSKVYGNINDVFICYKGIEDGQAPRHMIVLPGMQVRELEPGDISDPKISRQVNQRNTLDKWWEYEEVPRKTGSTASCSDPVPSPEPSSCSDPALSIPAQSTLPPRPSTTTPGPDPSTTTPKPDPALSIPAQSTLPPRPSTTTPGPDPSTTTPKPDPALSIPAQSTLPPRPSTTTPGPDPSTTTPKPDPSTTTPKPDPSTTTPKPDPSTTTPKPDPSTTTPKPDPVSNWSVAEGEALNQLLNKSGQFQFSRDDMEQIAAGKWDKFSGGQLTENEINAAKKLVDNDAELMKLLDTLKGRVPGSDDWAKGSDGYLGANEINPERPVK